VLFHDVKVIRNDWVRKVHAPTIACDVLTLGTSTWFSFQSYFTLRRTMFRITAEATFQKQALKTDLGLSQGTTCCLCSGKPYGSLVNFASTLSHVALVIWLPLNNTCHLAVRSALMRLWQAMPVISAEFLVRECFVLISTSYPSQPRHTCTHVLTRLSQSVHVVAVFLPYVFIPHVHFRHAFSNHPVSPILSCYVSSNR